MESPNYVLSTNENILVPKNEKIESLKSVVLAILLIILIGSFVFRDNLFTELPWSTRGLFVVIMIGVFISGNKRVPSPIELQFFDEYLIIYIPKRYYNRKVTRMEFNKFYYKDIQECEFRSKSQRINFFGIKNVEWYNYKKDGSLPEKPTIIKSGEGLCFFRTSAAPDVDFVAEIELHSPIKVTIRES
jgi:hypothetical protein